MSMKAVVSGGCGFIGSALVRSLVDAGWQVLNIDKLTYAGDTRTIASVAGLPNYSFLQADITDSKAMIDAVAGFRPDAIFHLAAESHVDRSIDGPGAFIETNIVGTYRLLDSALAYWRGLSSAKQENFRFLHVSTDEVYGSLGKEGLFTEDMAYRPNSPYSASKASADHLVRAWNKTYGLPALISNCSNNYGPFQNREKLIPTVIRKALSGQPIPIYGNGTNVRDWLYVDDHVDAMMTIVEKGRIGEKYNIGGNNELQNIDIAHQICAILDAELPAGTGNKYAEQIEFVSDRPGHDFRYAIDPGKVQAELNWKPGETFDTGIKKTVSWYLDNRTWLDEAGETADRLGLG